jgi:hypothetical protein
MLADAKLPYTIVLPAARVAMAAWPPFFRFDSGHALNAALLSVSLAPLSIFVLSSVVARSIPARWTALTAALIAIVATDLFLPKFTRYFYRGLWVQAGISSARQASQTGEELEPGDKGVFVVHHGRPFPLWLSLRGARRREAVNRTRTSFFAGPAAVRRSG